MRSLGLKWKGKKKKNQEIFQNSASAPPSFSTEFQNGRKEVFLLIIPSPRILEDHSLVLFCSLFLLSSFLTLLGFPLVVANSPSPWWRYQCLDSLFRASVDMIIGLAQPRACLVPFYDFCSQCGSDSEKC
jgi:hypothetical protein